MLHLWLILALGVAAVDSCINSIDFENIKGALKALDDFNGTTKDSESLGVATRYLSCMESIKSKGLASVSFAYLLQQYTGSEYNIIDETILCKRPSRYWLERAWEFVSDADASKEEFFRDVFAVVAKSFNQPDTDCPMVFCHPLMMEAFNKCADALSAADVMLFLTSRSKLRILLEGNLCAAQRIQCWPAMSLIEIDSIFTFQSHSMDGKLLTNGWFVPRLMQQFSRETWLTIFQRIGWEMYSFEFDNFLRSGFTDAEIAAFISDEAGSIQLSLSDWPVAKAFSDDARFWAMMDLALRMRKPMNPESVYNPAYLPFFDKRYVSRDRARRLLQILVLNESAMRHALYNLGVSGDAEAGLHLASLTRLVDSRSMVLRDFKSRADMNTFFQKPNIFETLLSQRLRQALLHVAKDEPVSDASTVILGEGVRRAMRHGLCDVLSLIRPAGLQDQHEILRAFSHACAATGISYRNTAFNGFRLYMDSNECTREVVLSAMDKYGWVLPESFLPAKGKVGGVRVDDPVHHAFDPEMDSISETVLYCKYIIHFAQLWEGLKFGKHSNICLSYLNLDEAVSSKSFPGYLNQLLADMGRLRLPHLPALFKRSQLVTLLSGESEVRSQLSNPAIYSRFSTYEDVTVEHVKAYNFDLEAVLYKLHTCTLPVVLHCIESKDGILNDPIRFMFMVNRDFWEDGEFREKAWCLVTLPALILDPVMAAELYLHRLVVAEPIHSGYSTCNIDNQAVYGLVRHVLLYAIHQDFNYAAMEAFLSAMPNGFDVESARRVYTDELLSRELPVRPKWQEFLVLFLHSARAMGGIDAQLLADFGWLVEVAEVGLLMSPARLEHLFNWTIGQVAQSLNPQTPKNPQALEALEALKALSHVLKADNGRITTALLNAKQAKLMGDLDRLAGIVQRYLNGSAWLTRFDFCYKQAGPRPKAVAHYDQFVQSRRDK